MRLWIVLVCLSLAATAAVADDPVRAIVPLEELTPDLRVLDRRGDLFLVEGSADRIAEIPGAGPLRTPPARLPASRLWAPLTDPDPHVQALADGVVWTDVQADLQWLVSLGTRYSLAANIHAVADSLEIRLAALGLATEQWDFDLNGSTVPNVIATQLGRVHPDSIFVLCAHFDAISEDPHVDAPGADDNGSGTVAVLTAARLLSVQGLGCTVKYVFFGGEEQGLWGSHLWAAEQRALGTNIAGALNFDMIGWWDTGAPFNLEIETNAHSRWIAEAVVDCADTYAAMPYILHEGETIWWGDHYSFWEQGYAAVNHEEAWDWGDPDFNPRYHTTQDLVEFLDPAFTTGNVRVAVTAIATLAGLTGSLAPADLPPLAAASLSAHPNPFNGRTRLELAVPGFTGPVQAGVYDLRGRQLRTVVLDVRDGRATATLEAVDERGKPLATGVYCVRAVLPSGPVTAKIAYLR